MTDCVASILGELRDRLRLGRATLRQDLPGPYPYPMTHELLAGDVESVADRVVDAGSSPTVRMLVRDRATVVVDDCRLRAAEDPDFAHAGFLEMLDSYGGLASYVAIPIFDGGRLYGVIALHHLGAPRHWTDDELELAGEAARRVGKLVLGTREVKGAP